MDGRDPVQREQGTGSRAVDIALWVLIGAVVILLPIVSLMVRPPRVLGQLGPILHLVSYAVLTFLILLAAVWRPGRGPGPFANRGPWVAVVLALVGVSMELLQGLPALGREAQVVDGAASVIGVGAGSVLWLGFRRLSTD